MSIDAGIPTPASEALDVWLRHHDEHVPGFVEGLYLVGSIPLGNWQPGSDADIIAFSAEPATGDQVDALRRAHDATIAELDGIDIDGPFLAWSDITHAPEPLVRPWTLHQEFHHDDGCFELNPVIWLTLAKYGVAVRGPDAATLDVHVDLDAVTSFIVDNTTNYWRSVAHSINNALEDPERVDFDSSVTSWTVLGVARMLYTVRTHDITSKSGAGRWILNELPEHRALIEHALAVRESGHTAPDVRATVRATAEFATTVANLVDQASQA